MLGTQVLPAAEPPGCQAPFPGKAVARVAWSFMEHLLVPYGKDRLEGESEVCFHCFQLAVFCGGAGWVLEFSVPDAGSCILHRGWRWLGGCGIPPRNQIPLSQA